MTKTCLDCAESFLAPRHGGGTMVRCRPCQSTNKKIVQGRALRSPRGRWGSGKLSAQYRGIPWEITLEQHAVLLARPCDYCGSALNESGSGLDRKATGPYCVENVVPCCWPCNRLRNFGAFTYEEMKTLGPALGAIWRSHGPSSLCLGGRPWPVKRLST